VWDCGYSQPPTSLAHYTAQPGLGGYQKATTADWIKAEQRLLIQLGIVTAVNWVTRSTSQQQPLPAQVRCIFSDQLRRASVICLRVNVGSWQQLCLLDTVCDVVSEVSRLRFSPFHPWQVEEMWLLFLIKDNVSNKVSLCNRIFKNIFLACWWTP